MMCEACVEVNNVAVLPWKNFSCVGDNLAQKVSLFVELQEYVEVYNGMWSVLVCSDVVFDKDVLYNIF